MPDVESLRHDGGVTKMLGYATPSPRCVADFLESFHCPDQVAQARAQAQRQERLSFIPEETAALWGLGQAARLRRKMYPYVRIVGRIWVLTKPRPCGIMTLGEG